MMFLLAKIFLGSAIVSAAKSAEEVALDDSYREMLDFIELNLANLLRQGQYPAIYNSSWPKVKDCGCFYAPSKITWGNQIGLQCARQFPDEMEAEVIEELMSKEYSVEECGNLCNNHHNLDVVLFCPSGWERDCGTGCRPPSKFDTVGDRVDFWEFTISAMLLHGQDYVHIDPDYLEMCNCASKPRPIRYGTKIGFDCIMNTEGEMQPGCRASAQCADSAGRQVVTFCPAGHQTTCSGCEKDVPSSSLTDRLEWMVHVTEGMVQLSLSMLRWTPMFEQVLGCGCKSGVKPIEYGPVGFVCEINGPDYITEACGPNIICQDVDGNDLIHICPMGFIPDCRHGCVNPVLRRKEKEDL